jgi:hypothetical protein
MKIRTIALGLATFAGGVAALGAGAIALARRQDREPEGQAEPGPRPLVQEPAPNGPTPHDLPPPTGLEGHAAPDLSADAAPGRAAEAFRPNIDAPMTPAEREALRPATGPSPSLVSDEGGSVQGVGGDRY